LAPLPPTKLFAAAEQPEILKSHGCIGSAVEQMKEAAN
jgi:hypothetical protein